MGEVWKAIDELGKEMSPSLVGFDIFFQHSFDMMKGKVTVLLLVFMTRGSGLEEHEDFIFF